MGAPIGNKNAAGSRGGTRRSSAKKKPTMTSGQRLRWMLGKKKPKKASTRVTRAFNPKIVKAHAKQKAAAFRKEAKLAAWRKKHSSFG